MAVEFWEYEKYSYYSYIVKSMVYVYRGIVNNISDWSKQQKFPFKQIFEKQHWWLIQ